MNADGIRDERDAGVSLVELIVTMFVSMIVLAIIGSLFITVTKATTDSITTRKNTGIAAAIMQETTRVIRGGVSISTDASTTLPAVIAGTGSSLTLDSYVDSNAMTPAPVQVAFAVTSGTLVETRTAATANGTFWTFNGATTSWKLQGPLDTSGTPLFTYLDASGTTITPAQSGLSAAQAANVAQILVTATVPNQLSRGNDPIVLSSNVAMPNVALAGVN